MTLEGHTSMIWTLTESLDEKLISGADDKKIIVWDLNNKTIDFVLYECKSEISSLLTLKDGKIVSGSGDKKLRVWNLNKKEIEKEIDCGFCAWCLKLINNNRFAAGMGNGDILIFNSNNFNHEITLKGHKRSINCLLEMSSNTLISGSDENDMIQWNLNDPEAKYILKGHEGGISSIIKIDEGRFASSSKDKFVKIWE